ncbi:hypothetical protein OXX79_000670 [Metschnikowia pulcherrima]
MSELHHRNFLPPYRSLVNPNVTYDYQTHREIHLGPHEIKKLISKFQSTQSQKPKSAFQMKYRSLLGDVSLKASILSRKVSTLKQGAQSLQTPSPTQNRCKSIEQLPVEIQIMILTYVDDTESYKSCLFTSKKLYELTKPFLLRSVSFTSTYRFAQFITYLRLDPSTGSYVLKVDLSNLQPGNANVELALEDSFYADTSQSNPHEVAAYLSQVLAGWRDWKYKNNLYALHPVAIPLSKSCTNLPSISHHQNQSKRIKLSKYFKRRKSQSNVVAHNSPPKKTLVSQNETSASSSHPRINRFLVNYASSRDLPVGYVVHLINLCPNLASLNLQNVVLSTDYRIKRTFQSRYQTYDLMNNYHKDVLRIVESMSPGQHEKNSQDFNPTFKSSFADITSSASSVFSIGTFSKPVRKYNSLLPPVNLVSPELHYASRGDGVSFLSDLSLKAINTAHLEIVNQNEIFRCLQKRQSTLTDLNMSSMIWINLKLVREFLYTVLAADIKKEFVDGREVSMYKGKMFDVGESISEGDKRPDSAGGSRGYTFDFRNSGMNKNLPWAQKIDTNTRQGERLVYRILNNELVSELEESVIRERRRRGRVGENYFS